MDPKKPKSAEATKAVGSTPKATDWTNKADSLPLDAPPKPPAPLHPRRLIAYLRARQPAFWQASFSGLLVLNAIVQIWFVSHQLSNATTATEISRQSLIAAQRAYLSYGEVEQEQYGIKIHVTNFGHVPAKIASGNFIYGRFAASNAALLDRREGPPVIGNTTIVKPAPATDFAVIVDLPFLSADEHAAIDSGAQGMVVDGWVRFDIGFDKTESDTLSIHTTYDRMTKKWTHVDEGIHVDLRNISSTAR